MSFLCDFPPYFKNSNSSLEYDTNVSLDFTQNSNLNSNSILLNNLPKYVNENEIKFNFSAQKKCPLYKKSLNI